MIVKFKNYGEEVHAFFKVFEYVGKEKRKCIQMYSIQRDDGGEWVEPYATITVNLPEYELPEPKLHGFYCFIDTNNCPWAEKLLLDTGIGINTGMSAFSGFCSYPVFFIFTANIKKYRCEL